MEPAIRVEVKGAAITKMMLSYAAAQEGEPFCIIGSSGRLEISVKNKSAAAFLGACRGDRIVLKKI